MMMMEEKKMRMAMKTVEQCENETKRIVVVFTLSKADGADICGGARLSSVHLIDRDCGQGFR